MMNRDEPAFPILRNVFPGVQPNGLTKREYAAIKMLAGIVSQSRYNLKAAEAVCDACDLADLLLQRLDRK